MAESWDMSFLIDQATQIQEARGNLGRHFGVLQQVLVGKHLVNFVGAEDRLPFLRMMGKLSQRATADIVSIRFKTPLSGEHQLAMQARPGPSPTTWWLLLSDGVADADAVPAIADLVEADAMASEAEFTALAQSIGSEMPSSMDLSVFRSALLADNQPAEMLSEAKSTELEQRIGDTLRENATGGIVTQSAPGEYALMHDKQVPAQQIADRIVVAADQAGVSAETLGLSHQTEAMPEDAEAKEVRDLIRNMRQDLAERGKPKRAHAASAGMDSARKPSLIDTLKSLVGR
ncbi:MAG TPA: PAS domain-containing protein [Dongiaceae bacterium]|jgi:hypothetical protein